MNDETARLHEAFELFEFGIEMKVASLGRQHPNASPAEIEDLLDAWLADRPPDADGIPVDLRAALTELHAEVVLGVTD